MVQGEVLSSLRAQCSAVTGFTLPTTSHGLIRVDYARLINIGVAAALDSRSPVPCISA